MKMLQHNFLIFSEDGKVNARRRMSVGWVWCGPVYVAIFFPSSRFRECAATMRLIGRNKMNAVSNADYNCIYCCSYVFDTTG